VLQHREANALAFWENAAAERRKQQKHIIGKMILCYFFLLFLTSYSEELSQ